MKKLKIILSLFIIPCVFAACNDDPGNYDYKEVNEITISGISDSYTVLFGLGHLRIDPKVEMTMDSPDNSARFEYSWTIKRDGGSMETLYNLGNSRTIDIIPELPVGTHYGFYQVIDKEREGVVYFKRFTLNIVTYNSRGWLLTGEGDDGNVDIAMIAMTDGASGDTVVYNNLFGQTNLPPLKGPIDFLDLGRRHPRMWLITESGSYYLDRETFAGSQDNTFNSLMYEPAATLLQPVEAGPRVSQFGGAAGDGYGRFIRTSDGSFYEAYILSDGDIYSLKRNVIDDKEFKIKGEMLYVPNASMYQIFVAYDGDNERFVKWIGPGGSGRNFEKLLDDSVEPFPWNQAGTNRTYIYGENTFNTTGDSRGNSYALMLDQSNQDMYIYMMNVSHNVAWGTPAPPTSKLLSARIPAGTTELETADFRAFMSNRLAVLYVKENRLYAYEFNPALPEPVSHTLDLGLKAGQEISMLKFDTAAQTGQDLLYISVYQPGAGSVLQKYNVLSTGGSMSLSPIPNARWEIDMKVTNMNWKNAN